MRARAVELAVAALLLSVICFALAPSYLEHWDEVQLSLGMRRFDLAWHQPHPPGYVLFVLAGRVLGKLTGVAHPGRLLSWIATVSISSFILIQLPLTLARGVRVAFAVAVALVVLLSPTLLTHVTTGRTYVVEAALWTAALLLFVTRARGGVLGGLLGVAGGFRPTLLVWGVALLIAWAIGRTRRELAEAAGAFLAGASAWVVALAILCGGLGRYVALSSPLLADNVFGKSMFARGVVPVLSERLPLMLQVLWLTLGPLLVGVVALLVVRARRPELRRLDPLLYGAALAFVFYLVMIFDSDGYALSYALPLLAWATMAAATIVPPRIAGGAFAAMAVAWVFLPGGLGTHGSVPAARARTGERCAARLAAIESLPAESTLIVTGAENLSGWSFRMIMERAPSRPILQLAYDRFFPYLAPDHPYLAARELTPMAVSEGVDLATLPYFTAPLRYVVFAAPKEAASRIDRSCASHTRQLASSPGETLPVIDVVAIRVHARGGRLVCE